MAKASEMERNAGLDWALMMDKKDPLGALRKEFYIPEKQGKPLIYFCGNSLGLQPKRVKAAIEQELEDWKNYAIDGFSEAKNPWMSYQDGFTNSLAILAGARPLEVTVMNTLSVNLHLMMLSLYHPDKKRFRILMEEGAFPGDRYAVEAQVKFHGLDPSEAIIEIGVREGEQVILPEDIEKGIHQYGDQLSLVLLGGINYYTGQFFDLSSITALAHKAGAVAGFDLAHAIGNTPLQLHDWDVDFAVWCSYKFLNGGPGAVGGAYLHERFALNPGQLRMAGWWGNDEKTRFLMEKQFVPQPGAGGWQISTAQVFNMVSLKAALEIFQLTSMEELRKKSIQLTSYLEFLLKGMGPRGPKIITPGDPGSRGAQLSLFFGKRARELHLQLTDSGVVSDYREPDVIRVAPAPLYNTFEEVFRFGEILGKLVQV